MTTDVQMLPKYTKKEEIYNSTSHFLGALFAVGTLIAFIVIGINKGYSFLHMIPFYVYSLFMFMMFFVSGLYHSRRFNSKSRAVVRIVDHSDIYAFVAATYFPICMYGVTNEPIAYTMLGIQVGLGVLGVVLSIIPSNSRWVKLSTFFIYIIQGWLLMIFYPFGLGMPSLVFLFVLLGGIVYTIGSLLYAIGRYKRWSHTWFHAFVLIAAVLQFVGVYFLL